LDWSQGTTSVPTTTARLSDPVGYTGPAQYVEAPTATVAAARQADEGKPDSHRVLQPDTVDLDLGMAEGSLGAGSGPFHHMDRGQAEWLPGPRIEDASPLQRSAHAMHTCDQEEEGCTPETLQMEPEARISRMQAKIRYSGVEKKIQNCLLDVGSQADNQSVRALVDFYRLTPDAALQRYTMICGGTFAWCLVIPAADRQRQEDIARYFHEQHGHCGSDQTYRLVRMRYYWANMPVTISRDVTSCDQCLRKKASNRKPYGKPMPGVMLGYPMQ
jgi:hypothetical protein